MPVDISVGSWIANEGPADEATVRVLAQRAIQLRASDPELSGAIQKTIAGWPSEGAGRETVREIRAGSATGQTIEAALLRREALRKTVPKELRSMEEQRNSAGAVGALLLGDGARERMILANSQNVSASAKIPIAPVENSTTPEVTNKSESGNGGGRKVLRGRDVEEIIELKREGLSIRAISRLTGYNRKTVKRFLLRPEGRPVYGPRAAALGKLEAFKPYLKDRLQAGVWNARVLLRELRGRNYSGSYTLLTDWLRPQRKEALSVAVRRFETPPGKQAQVDWGHLGSITESGEVRQLWGLTITLGYSRRMMAEAATDQKLGTLLRMHETAFQEWGAVPEAILYDRMRTVWTGTDERGEIVWNSIFLDFARYWGFTPRLCRPYRAQTKGKVESGVKYVRRNFLCGLQGREPTNLSDLNAELRRWVAEVANRRIHGTTHEQVLARWDEDQFAMQPVPHGRPPYPYLDDEQRKVARDAYVSWRGSRYSVPWLYAGKEVWVRDQGSQVEVRHGADRIALHAQAVRHHQVVTLSEHHAGIPLGSQSNAKTLIHIEQSAPVVERRSLAAYESLAGGAL